MSTTTASPSMRGQLYANMSLLESVAKYARHSAGEVAAPKDIPKLSRNGSAFLAHWQGHAAVRLWLRLAQPTLRALETFVELDLGPASDDSADVDNQELRDALEASEIALSTLVQRLEFQAQRWSPDSAAS